MRWIVLTFAVASGGTVAIAAADPVPPPRIWLALSGNLPFTEAQLREALRARFELAGGPSAHTVTVTLRGEPPAITMQVGDKKRMLRLPQGQSALDSARLVSVALHDLLLGTIAVGKLPSIPPTQSIAPTSSPTSAPSTQPTTQPTTTRPALNSPVAKEFVRPPATSRSASNLPPLRVGLASAVVKGFDAGDRVGGQIGLDLSLQLGRFLVAAAISWWTNIDRPRGPYLQAKRLTFNALATRIEVGLRYPSVDLRIGALVAPYALEGTSSQQGTLGGVGTRIGFNWPIVNRLLLCPAIGADFLFNQVEDSSFGEVLASPRVAISIGIGVAWQVHP